MKVAILFPEKEFRKSPDGTFDEELWFSERKINITAALQRLGHKVVEQKADFTIYLQAVQHQSENDYPWTDAVERPVFFPGDNTFTLVALNCNSRVDVAKMLDPVWNEQLEQQIIEYFETLNTTNK